jgi:membrane protein implicated in regulation of membrane protease activity
MPDAPFSFGVASMAVILIMIVLAVVAIVASLKGHPAVLLVIFGVSFFPIGLYVLGVPHWIQWVGLSNMGYLLASIVIWRFRPPKDEQSAQSG